MSPEEFLEARGPGPYYATEPIHLKGYRLIVRYGGRAGCAVAPSGEIESLFSHQGAPISAGSAVVREAISLGGTRCVFFDVVNPKAWQRLGFAEVAREPFDRTRAPADWDYERYGTPDLLRLEVRR